MSLCPQSVMWNFIRPHFYLWPVPLFLYDVSHCSRFIADFLDNMAVKEYWKLVRDWWRFGQEFGVSFIMNCGVWLVTLYIWSVCHQQATTLVDVRCVDDTVGSLCCHELWCQLNYNINRYSFSVVLILQFTYEYRSKRIIEIGPHVPTCS